MARQPQANYPGGSKSRVTRAGAAIRAGDATEADFAVVETWRTGHRSVLNTLQGILRNRARGKAIVVAQRRKRKHTIFDKLQRLPRMELARMDDIAGCRLFFNDIAGLNEFRQSLHEAHFRHRRRNENDKYDYIGKPKETGYRGIHDVYEYDANSDAGADYKGLYAATQRSPGISELTTRRLSIRPSRGMMPSMNGLSP